MYTTNPIGNYSSDVLVNGKPLNYVGEKQSVEIAKLGLKVDGLYYWSSSKEGTGSTSANVEPIAVVMNGSEKTEVTNHAEIIPLIKPDGTTVIKMLKDYTAEGAAFLNNVYTCTLDLNGHTVGSTTNNAITIKKVGTKNTTTVITMDSQ